MNNPGQATPEQIGSIEDLSSRIANKRSRLQTDRRLLVAIAGAPGSGKSTLAAALLNTLEHAVIVPMDGFHLDNCLLDEAKLRAVKGAPETFDAAGLKHMLERIAGNEATVYLPVFDRESDLSRAAASVVTAETSTVLVEGNYLLLDEPEWAGLAQLFDITIHIDVSELELRERLVNRWLDLDLSISEAVSKAEGNDLPNGRRVLNASIAADIVYSPGTK